MSLTTTIHQCVILEAPQSAIVRNYSLEAIARMEVDFRAALPQEPPFAVGVSVELEPVGPNINTLALATQDQVFCLSFQRTPSPAQKESVRKILEVQYLSGFEFPYTITLLARTLGSSVSGYDLSTLKNGAITTPGDFFRLYKYGSTISSQSINELWDGGILRGIDAKAAVALEPNYALRAWLTAIAAKTAIQDLPLGQRISTQVIDNRMLQIYANLAHRTMRRDLLKPRIQENDFSEVEKKRDGNLIVHNSRFKTRIRMSGQTRLEICQKSGLVVGATIKGAEGRRSSARTKKPLKDEVVSIRVIGREERTNSEKAQYHFLLLSLTVASASSTPLFVNHIWFPKNTRGSKLDKTIYSSCEHLSHILERLNDSQREIVGAMLSPAPQDSLVIVHGPPGTGKTTTIAAASAIWVSRKLPCWIIAQSNVGVKNIAEKLFTKKVDFRLIVSQEFYFEWHEKLYEKIQDKVVRSDDLPDSMSGVSKTFRGITVVLCTLSMLSNPKLADCGLFGILPVNSLVIDEASQIDVFEFMHLFYKFSKELSKVCFFGDPKQLPPYGSEEAGLETIFDVRKLKKKANFLDTQYRLPIHLGKFISGKVYDGKLQSEHEIADYSCIAFIDVGKGKEMKRGNSYLNMEEVHMVVRVAGQYHKHRLDFCIITFYDPQRAAIIEALENADLPSERVHNVDSFQGNEADYVILSSVRTKWPGFLKSQPRMNVALTRCRKGMVVVTDKSFLQGKGKKTLLGQLCHTWSKHRDDCWNDWNAVLNNSVALPGLLAPSSRSNGTRRPSGHATTPRRHPPSKAQARTHNGQSTPSTSAGLASGSPSVIGSEDRTTATAVRRNTRPLTSASASGQSAHRRSRKGRK